jgi:hypothetical protein
MPMRRRNDIQLERDQGGAIANRPQNRGDPPIDLVDACIDRASRLISTNKMTFGQFRRRCTTSPSVGMAASSNRLPKRLGSGGAEDPQRRERVVADHPRRGAQPFQGR